LRPSAAANASVEPHPPNRRRFVNASYTDLAAATGTTEI